MKPRDLGCKPLQLAYNWEASGGTLILADGDCCDMQACIDLFFAIDPAVYTIQTYSGTKADARYWRDGGEWKVAYPRTANL